MSDYFDTRIKIEDAYYDEEQSAILIFVVIVMTGEKKILVEPKGAFHYGEGVSGDFPDRLMHQRVSLWKRLKGKVRSWRLYTDAATQTMTSEIVEKAAHRVGVQMEEITETLSEDGRILERKKEDLIAAEEKKKSQQQAIDRLRNTVQRENQ